MFVEKNLELFDDEAIEEILINGAELVTCLYHDGHRVFIENSQKIENLVDEIQDFARLQGIRIDRLRPAGGGILFRNNCWIRWHAMLPPAAFSGPQLSLRRLLLSGLNINDFSEDSKLIKKISLIPSCDLVFFGGETGSGKTTLLTTLANQYLYRERVFVIETLAEITRVSPHWVQLVTQAADLEGRGAISGNYLIEQSLRLRPDRFIFGEIRGIEAEILFQLGTTASAGIWTTIHTSQSSLLVPRLASLSGNCEDEWRALFNRLKVFYVQLKRKSPRLSGLFQFIDGEFQEC